jgi:hypothetical protein
MKKFLHSSEWFLVASLLIIMSSLVLIAKVNTARLDPILELKEVEKVSVLVTVEGAVSKPGEYLIESGTTVGEVLRKARPKPWADLQKVNPSEIIESPRNIKVEELTEITVNVQGAVAQSVEIKLPARSRICDLKSKVSLAPRADKTFFRRRRLLKNGEIIDVPNKTVE